MKGMISALTVALAVLGTPAMAAGKLVLLDFHSSEGALPLGDVLSGTLGTVGAVLQAPGATVAGVVQALPAALGATVKVVGETVIHVPGVLLGQPVDSAKKSVVLPLPGPDFLNLTVISVQDVFSVSVGASAPLEIKFTSGAQ